MLNIYTKLQYFLEDTPFDFIDLSNVPTNKLADKMDTIYDHYTSGNIYIGFLEPILMLTPQEEVRMRKVFRKFEVFVIVGNPFILPFSWKNGIRKLVMSSLYQNVNHPETLHNGGAACV